MKRRRKHRNQRKGRGRPVFALLVLAALLAFGAMYEQGLFPALRTLVLTGAMRVENLFGQGPAPVIEQEWFSGEMYLVADAESDEILASGRAEEEVVPASLSKLFTAEYALRILDPDAVVEVDMGALHMLKEGASSAKLVPGAYTVRDLVAGMLIPSGNDAAYALAAAAGRVLSGTDLSTRDACGVFLEYMAEAMEQDGYLHTVITDPSGDAPEDTTTALELWRLTRAALTRPVVDEAVRAGRRDIRMADGYETGWSNTNPFVRKDATEFHPRITGVKTGTLNGSHHLALRYERGGRSLLIFLLDAPSAGDRVLRAHAMIEAIETNR